MTNLTESILENDFRNKTLCLPDDRFVREFVNPVEFFLLANVRAKTRREALRRKREENNFESWGYFDLPPAPGTEGAVRLIYLDPGGGGCSHQTLAGGCWGCDYHGSLSSKKSPEDLKRVIEEIFTNLEQGELADFYKNRSFIDINIIASGSLLDPLEIPSDVLDKIIKESEKYQEKHKDKKIVFETEARFDDLVIYDPKKGEWVIREDLLMKLDKLGSKISGERVTIGVGLESMSPLVSEGCINKGLPPMEEIIRLQNLIHEKFPHVYLLPHIWLGTNFLTEKERINDCVSSIIFCMENQITDKNGQVILMVMNQRNNSPLGRLIGDFGVLVENGILPDFKLPSIWSVGEVLRKIGYDRASKVMIRGFTTSEENVRVVEACCEKTQRMLNIVMNWEGSQGEWNNLNDIYLLHENSGNGCCPHYHAWKTDLGQEFKTDLKERIYETLNLLVNKIFEKKLDDEFLKDASGRFDRVLEIKKSAKVPEG